MNPVYIYALSDPQNPRIPRYIGRTKRHPRQRFFEHFVLAYKKPNLPLSQWLKSLDQSGKMPKLVVYELITDPTISPGEREAFWTRLFRPFGLLNLKTGNSHSSEHMKKLRREWLLTPSGKQWRVNIRNSNKSRPMNPVLVEAFKKANSVNSKSVVCLETEQICNSKNEAARHLGVHVNALTYAITKKTKCGGLHWELVNKEI